MHQIGLNCVQIISKGGIHSLVPIVLLVVRDLKVVVDDPPDSDMLVEGIEHGVLWPLQIRLTNEDAHIMTPCQFPSQLAGMKFHARHSRRREAIGNLQDSH